MSYDAAKAREEFRAKNEVFAQAIGVERLIAHLEQNGPTRERVEAALDAGDEHLNTIPLGVWDCAAYWDASPMHSGFFITRRCSCNEIMQRAWKYCPRCGRIATSLGYNRPPFDKAGANKSCAERVCVLKYVAEVHYARKERTSEERVQA